MGARRSGRRPALTADAHGRLLVAYGAACLIPVVLLVLFLIGSLVLSGAQATPDGAAHYDAPVPFPVFIVADWLVIACAAVATLLVVPVAATTAVLQANHLVGAVSYTLAAMLAGAFFAFAFPSPAGPIVVPADPPVTLGWHVLGPLLGVACLIVLFVRVAMIGPRYERLRKAGEVPIEDL